MLFCRHAHLSHPLTTSASSSNLVQTFFFFVPLAPPPPSFLPLPPRWPSVAALFPQMTRLGLTNACCFLACRATHALLWLTLVVDDTNTHTHTALLSQPRYSLLHSSSNDLLLSTLSAIVAGLCCVSFGFCHRWCSVPFAVVVWKSEIILLLFSSIDRFSGSRTPIASATWLIPTRASPISSKSLLIYWKWIIDFVLCFTIAAIISTAIENWLGNRVHPSV